MKTRSRIKQASGERQKERPIIFSAPMVRAILDGRKTQTRRIITKPEFQVIDGNFYVPKDHRTLIPSDFAFCCCPYGVAGDRLWVRETWQVNKVYDPLGARLIYQAMGGDVRGCVHYCADKHVDWAGRKRPSIHMPRWASRITLEITKVRVERLQDISREDAISEGVAWCDYQNKSGDTCERCGARLFSDAGEPPWHSPIVEYQLFWDSLHGKGAWEKNPCVWVIEFCPVGNEKSPTVLIPQNPL
jgi:hypothetical protein